MMIAFTKQPFSPCFRDGDRNRMRNFLLYGNSIELFAHFFGLTNNNHALLFFNFSSY